MAAFTGDTIKHLAELFSLREFIVILLFLLAPMGLYISYRRRVRNRRFLEKQGSKWPGEIVRGVEQYGPRFYMNGGTLEFTFPREIRDESLCDLFIESGLTLFRKVREIG